MKGIFSPYVLWPFDKKLIFLLVTRIRTRDCTVYFFELKMRFAGLFFICVCRWKKMFRKKRFQKISARLLGRSEYLHNKKRESFIYLCIIYLCIIYLGLTPFALLAVVEYELTEDFIHFSKSHFVQGSSIYDFVCTM